MFFLFFFFFFFLLKTCKHCKSYSHFFFQQKLSEYCKTVNEMTFNELVKLTTLWTTGPRCPQYQWIYQVWWKFFFFKWSHCDDTRTWPSPQTLGPVVQSIISLTSSLVVNMLTVLVSTISNLHVFLLKKMWLAFANTKATNVLCKKY